MKMNIYLKIKKESSNFWVNIKNILENKNVVYK